MKKEIFAEELGFIKNESIKSFAEIALEHLPDYFFSIAASTTGKYHPQYALGEGGLTRHTKAAVRFANHMFEIEQMQNEYTQEEMDCAIVALLLHDGFKQGLNGSSGYTTHEHPQLCADWVRESEQLNNVIIPAQRNMIAEAIASHMGEWNKNKHSQVVLDKPESKIQKIVHLCDYLASRKDIEVLFDVNEEPFVPDVNTYTMQFGKYKGEKLVDVASKDKGYLRWLSENTKLSRPLDKLIPEVLNADN